MRSEKHEAINDCYWSRKIILKTPLIEMKQNIRKNGLYFDNSVSVNLL